MESVFHIITILKLVVNEFVCAVRSVFDHQKMDHPSWTKARQCPLYSYSNRVQQASFKIVVQYLPIALTT